MSEPGQPPAFRLSFPQLPDHRITWSADQQAALAASDAQLLIPGAAGTGKTTVLVEKVAQRVREGARLDQLLVLAHTRPAAQQLRTQIVQSVGGAHLQPRVLTPHGAALGILRQHADHDVWGEAILLRAPEQEFRLRELLSGHDKELWPAELKAASATRVFSSQLRQLLARARQLGLDPDDLTRSSELDPNWVFLGEFFDEYLTVLDFEGTLDYGELIHRTRLLLRDDAIAMAVCGQFKGVLCDDVQAFDPGQLGLLADLAALGLPLVMTANPSLGVFGFRGADSNVTRWFGESFEHGGQAPLTTNHRAGGDLTASWDSVAAKLNAASRPPAYEQVAAGVGHVSARVFDSRAAELSHVAAELRRLHLVANLPWSQMAVITRSGRLELTSVASAMRHAGIPVEVSGHEIALAEQPAVWPLLLALSLLGEESIDADAAQRLLTSPLVGLTPVELRAFGRELRDQLAAESVRPEPAATLVGRAVSGELVLELDSEVGARVAAFSQLLRRASAAFRSGASIHTLLWQLWDGTPWSAQLQDRAVRFGDLQANSAIDAVCELMDMAAGQPTLTGVRGRSAFIAEITGQQIPADTGRESDPRGRGVQVMTAHKAAGSEFANVFVIGLNEGKWPRLVQRSTMLDPADLIEGPAAPISESTVAQERRLFLLAITRASRGLWLSGHQGAEGEGERPSRFLAEAVAEVERVGGLPPASLTIAGLVGDLRHISTDPGVDPGVRQAAAVRLARLATASDAKGRPLAPMADPAKWWGTQDVTQGKHEPRRIRISGTDLGMLTACPRRWFLSKNSADDRHTSAAALVGSLIHLVAQHVQGGYEVGADTSRVLDEVWQSLPFEAAWLSASERDEVGAALERLVAWQEANAERRVLGTEVGFEVELEIAGRPVKLVGVVDRLEITSDGRLRVVDFKTGRQIPDARSVAQNEQLGVYQLAAVSGAFDHLAPGVRALAPAELVYLRGSTGKAAFPKVLTQQPIVDDPACGAGANTWVHDRLESAVSVISSQDYRSQICDACRYCRFQLGCPALLAGKGEAL